LCKATPSKFTDEEYQVYLSDESDESELEYNP